MAVASAGPYASLHSLQTDNHPSTPPLSLLQAGCPSCRPTNCVKAQAGCPSCRPTNNVKALKAQKHQHDYLSCCSLVSCNVYKWKASFCSVVEMDSHMYTVYCCSHHLVKFLYLFPHFNPDWFYLSSTGLSRLSWKRGR